MKRNAGQARCQAAKARIAVVRHRQGCVMVGLLAGFAHLALDGGRRRSSRSRNTTSWAPLRHGAQRGFLRRTGSATMMKGGRILARRGSSWRPALPGAGRPNREQHVPGTLRSVARSPAASVTARKGTMPRRLPARPPALPPRSAPADRDQEVQRRKLGFRGMDHGCRRDADGMSGADSNAAPASVRPDQRQRMAGDDPFLVGGHHPARRPESVVAMPRMRLVGFVERDAEPAERRADLPTHRRGVSSPMPPNTSASRPPMAAARGADLADDAVTEQIDGPLASGRSEASSSRMSWLMPRHRAGRTPQRRRSSALASMFR